LRASSPRCGRTRTPRREVVGARARGDVHDRARVAPVLRAERGVVDLELLHGVDRRLERDLVLHHVVQVDAVDHEVDGVFTVAGGVEGERALAAQRRGQESVLRAGVSPSRESAARDRRSAGR
jgi:hypothetical protein